MTAANSTTLWPPGSRLAVRGRVRGKVHLRGRRLLIQGDGGCGQLAGTLICGGPGCSVVARHLAVRKVLVVDGAVCHLHSCTVCNPYGVGVQFVASSGSLVSCRVERCADAGVLMHVCPAMWVASNRIAHCRLGVRCSAATAATTLKNNVFDHSVCALRVESGSPHIQSNIMNHITGAGLQMSASGGVVEHNMLQGVVHVEGRSNPVLRHNEMTRCSFSAGWESTPILYQNTMWDLRADPTSHPVVMWNTIVQGRPLLDGSGIHHMNHLIQT